MLYMYHHTSIPYHTSIPCHCTCITYHTVHVYYTIPHVYHIILSCTMPQLAMLCFIVPVHHPILHHVIHAALYHSQSQYNTNYSHFTWSIHMMHHWHTLYHGYHITSYLTKSHLLYPHNTSHVPCTLATIYCAMKYHTIPQYITPCLTMSCYLKYTGTSSPIPYISMKYHMVPHQATMPYLQ